MIEFRQFKHPHILDIYGRLPAGEANAFLDSSNLLVLMQNGYFLEGRPACLAIPAKVYTYFFTRKPILALIADREISELVLNYGRGIVVAPDDVEGLLPHWRRLWTIEPRLAGRRRSS